VCLSEDSNVWRLGGHLYRPASPWTPAVHHLRGHLEAVGFRGASQLVDGGLDVHGRQVLTFVEGEPVHPKGWSDEGVVAAGRLLRGLHDATTTFVPLPDSVWMPWFTRAAGPDTIVGHGDVGPWNVISRDGLPVAFVDWEFAGPVRRLDEVAEAARLHCQLHGEDVAHLQDLPTTEARARQLRLFVDAYGLAPDDRVGFVDRMIEAAVRGYANDTDEAGITPDFVGPHPMVWGMAWQARGARWLLENRAQLEDAVGGDR
jgi:hypothetical protein